MSKNYLPLLLVSASNLDNASKLLSEIIDNEVMESDKKQRNGRVWRITNKYYCVDIEVCTVLDGESLPPALEDLEAHIIYITNSEEETAERAAEARLAALAGAAAAAPAQVRLAVCEGSDDDALRDWARRRGYESVALAAPAAPDDERGAERVQAALHAHVWRGLRRIDRRAGEGAGRADSDSDSESASVERAEAFAAALGALQGAAPPDAALSDAERRRRAESVVAAFCRALGHDLSAP